MAVVRHALSNIQQNYEVGTIFIYLSHVRKQSHSKCIYFSTVFLGSEQQSWSLEVSHFYLMTEVPCASQGGNKCSHSISI